MCDRPSLVTAAELAEVLNMPVGTVRDIAARRDWPRFKVGHAVRFDVDEILGLVRNETESADAVDMPSAPIVRKLRAVRPSKRSEGVEAVGT